MKGTLAHLSFLEVNGRKPKDDQYVQFSDHYTTAMIINIRMSIKLKTKHSW